MSNITNISEGFILNLFSLIFLKLYNNYTINILRLNVQQKLLYIFG